MSVIINNYHAARETDGRIGDAWNYVKHKWNKAFTSELDNSAFNSLHCADLVEKKNSLNEWNAPACVKSYEKGNFKKVYENAEEGEKEMIEDAIKKKCINPETDEPLDFSKTQYPNFCKELTK